MDIDKRKFASISGTILHGNAGIVSFKSVVPMDKSDKEVFWTKELVDKFKDKYEYKTIESNPDDSDGKHDVIITFSDETIIGVQVTELTYELERARKHIKDSYTKNIIQELQTSDLKSKDKVVFSIKFPYSDIKKPNSEKPKKVVDTIRKLITDGVEEKLYKFDFGSIICQLIKENDFYIPNVNNIGIDVNFNNLPRSLDMYSDCIDAIVLKKSNSLSSWLLIWSLEFWKDRHWLGNELIDYTKEQFKDSKFDKVFFIESMDGEGIFHANINVDEIK